MRVAAEITRPLAPFAPLAVDGTAVPLPAALALPFGGDGARAVLCESIRVQFGPRLTAEQVDWKHLVMGFDGMISRNAILAFVLRVWVVADPNAPLHAHNGMYE